MSDCIFEALGVNGMKTASFFLNEITDYYLEVSA